MLFVPVVAGLNVVSSTPVSASNPASAGLAVVPLTVVNCPPA